MRGAKAGITLERRNGRHWVGNVMVRIESPGFEPNDMGRIGSADGNTLAGRLEYRETVPGRWLRGYAVSVSDEHEWNFGGDQQVGLITPRLRFEYFFRVGIKRR